MLTTRSAVEMVLDLIANGDWNTVDDFDEELDVLTEYSNSVRDSVVAFNEEMAAC